MLLYTVMLTVEQKRGRAINSAKWRKTHPEENRRRAAIANKKWSKAHPEHRAAICAAWYKDHRAHVKEKSRDYAKEHKEQVKAKDKDYDRRRRAFVNTLKARPCHDCGGTFPPCCMDFDHRNPSTKKGLVSRMFRRRMSLLLEEIQKCDVVCANCHRIRTRQAFVSSLATRSISHASI